MHFSTLLVPALAALASAVPHSTTVVSLFEPFANNPMVSAALSKYPGGLGGSIVGVNADYTTYQIQCMTGGNCGVSAPYTIVAGPTTMSVSTVVEHNLYGTMVTATLEGQCSFTHMSESAMCTETEKVDFNGHHTATTVTQSVPTGAISYYPLTVTAGLSKLNSPQATQAAGVAAGPAKPMITAAPLGAAAALALAAML